MNLEYEYVVVGSGAGGGTVAARLAEAGHTVCLLEAGGDPLTLHGVDPNSNGVDALPQDYLVPVFHGLSTENDALKWDFFVRHYQDQTQQQKDIKFVPAEDGVFYPRAGTLGGCTAFPGLKVRGYTRSDGPSSFSAACKAHGIVPCICRGLESPLPRTKSPGLHPFRRTSGFFRSLFSPRDCPMHLARA